jgi:hypothetical protein
VDYKHREAANEPATPDMLESIRMGEYDWPENLFEKKDHKTRGMRISPCEKYLLAWCDKGYAVAYAVKSKKLLWVTPGSSTGPVTAVEIVEGTGGLANVTNVIVGYADGHLLQFNLFSGLLFFDHGSITKKGRPVTSIVALRDKRILAFDIYGHMHEIDEHFQTPKKWAGFVKDGTVGASLTRCGNYVIILGKTQVIELNTVTMVKVYSKYQYSIHGDHSKFCIGKNFHLASTEKSINLMNFQNKPKPGCYLEEMFPSEIIHSAVFHKNYIYCLCGGPWSEAVQINLTLKIYDYKDWRFVYQPAIWASNGHSGVSYAIEVSKCNKYLFTSAFQPGFGIGTPRGSTVKQWEILNSGAMVQLLHEYVNCTPEAIFKIQPMSLD